MKKPHQDGPSFLWGAATSSHQIEGNNHLNDWWVWEKTGRIPFASGHACDSWNRMDEDIRLIRELGHNAYRFSIEWSRIEPEENVWDDSALAQYRDMIEKLNRHGIEPVVTLHHFTNPQWFACKGGWLQEEAPQYFRRYVQRVADAFHDQVRIWITINEPLVYLSHSFLFGIWPPGHKSFKESTQVFRQMLRAHAAAYQSIHVLYQSKGLKAQVGIAKHLSSHEPENQRALGDRFSSWLRDYFFNDLFLDAAKQGFLFAPGVFCEPLPYKNTLDFIGVNYYTRHMIRFGGWSSEGIFGIEPERKTCDSAETNLLGWEVYPKGLYHVLKKLKRFDCPLMITENGICTDDDAQRSAFINSHLHQLELAISEGIRVVGYFHWSLLDNFEWDKGFAPRFGIIHVNFENFERKIKQSAYVLSDFCRKLCSGKQDNTSRPL